MASNRAPRLAIVTLTLDTGGTERHIARIAPGLAAGGLDVTIVCLGRPGVQAEAVRQQGVRVVGPARTAQSFHRSARGTALALSVGTTVLAGEFLLRRPDIAHFFLPLSYLIGARIARLARIPHLVMSRRSQNDYQTKRSWIAAVEHRLHRRMDLILANSHRVYDELVEEEGADPSRTGLIYNGLDIAAYAGGIDSAGLRQQLGISASALVLAIVANLMPYKGHADLIAALGRSQAGLPPDWRLLVIGRDDGLGPTLRAQAASLGLAGHIDWLGERHDVPDLLRIADIGLNVSHEEGFSNAVIEGMAAGLPMLVTDAGGNAEAVPDGVAGRVVPTKSPDALAAALMALAGDRKLRTAMGRAAHERAVGLFSLNTCVGHYLEAYRAVLAGGPMPPGIDPRHMRLASGSLPG